MMKWRLVRGPFSNAAEHAPHTTQYDSSGFLLTD